MKNEESLVVDAAIDEKLDNWHDLYDNRDMSNSEILSEVLAFISELPLTHRRRFLKFVERKIKEIDSE